MEHAPSKSLPSFLRITQWQVNDIIPRPAEGSGISEQKVRDECLRLFLPPHSKMATPLGKPVNWHTEYELVGVRADKEASVEPK